MNFLLCMQQLFHCTFLLYLDFQIVKSSFYRVMYSELIRKGVATIHDEYVKDCEENDWLQSATPPLYAQVFHNRA